MASFVWSIRVQTMKKSSRSDGNSVASVDGSFLCEKTVHVISFCVSFLSRVDELNKLACSQCMSLHSSACRVL